MKIIKITTIHNEEIICECYNYNEVKKRKNISCFTTNKGAIPLGEVKEVAIISE